MIETKMNVAIDGFSIAERLQKTGMSTKTARQVAKEVVHNSDQLATKEGVAFLGKRIDGVDRKMNFIMALVGITFAVVGAGFVVVGTLIASILTAIQ